MGSHVATLPRFEILSESSADAGWLALNPFPEFGVGCSVSHGRKIAQNNRVVIPRRIIDLGGYDENRSLSFAGDTK
jgi:hypothetical protein